MQDIGCLSYGVCGSFLEYKLKPFSRTILFLCLLQTLQFGQDHHSFTQTQIFIYFSFIADVGSGRLQWWKVQ